jgi:hypothetical protein
MSNVLHVYEIEIFGEVQGYCFESDIPLKCEIDFEGGVSQIWLNEFNKDRISKNN